MSIYKIINDKTRTLPFYIYSIGNDPYQNACIREKGFLYHHLISVVNGEGYVECDGKKEKITKGDIFFIAKDVPHAYYSKSETFATKWITFDGTAVSSVLNSYNINNFVLLKQVNLEKLDNSFESLYAKVDSSLNDYEISAYLYLYITTFFNCSKTSDTIKVISKAVNYIKKNFSDYITLDDLALISNMNKFTFCREFKKIYSATPFDYLLHVRVQEAKKILTDSNMKINDISIATGFNDTGYFCRIFKKFENCTPSEFRKMIKKDG